MNTNDMLCHTCLKKFDDCYGHAGLSQANYHVNINCLIHIQGLIPNMYSIYYWKEYEPCHNRDNKRSIDDSQSDYNFAKNKKPKICPNNNQVL